MWKIEIVRKHESTSGFSLEDKMIFEVEDLVKAEEVIKVFEIYGVGEHKYSITRKAEEEEA